MSALIKTIGGLFDPVLNFFQQVWDYISTFLAFLWDLISGLYYGFNTIISHVWNVIENITGLSFITDNAFVFADLASLLGITSASLFNGLLLCSIFLVCLRFVFSLIPFFHK